MSDAFVQARHYHAGRLKPIRLVCVHATAGSEGNSSAEGVARYFQTTDREASAHYVCDSDSGVDCVKESDTAWAAKGANADGLHVEICGQATQTAAQWADVVSLKTLERAANKVAYWCRKYDLPVRYLTVEQIRDGKSRGITFHADVDKALPSTGHTDPGKNFPRTQFLERVKHYVHEQDAAAGAKLRGWGR